MPTWGYRCKMCDLPMSSRDQVMESRDRPGYCQPCHEKLMDDECHECGRGLGRGPTEVEETKHTANLCVLCDQERGAINT